MGGNLAFHRDRFLSPTDPLATMMAPYAQMHGNILRLLKDYSPVGTYTDWEGVSRDAAADYASFLLRKMKSSWKKQVCRSLRYRNAKASHEKGITTVDHALKVIRPSWHPHAGESCEDHCKDKKGHFKPGFCSFCGGPGNGACCLNNPRAPRITMLRRSVKAQ